MDVIGSLVIDGLCLRGFARPDKLDMTVWLYTVSITHTKQKQFSVWPQQLAASCCPRVESDDS